MVKRMRLLASAGTFLAAIEYKAAANSLSIVPQFREKYSGLMTNKVLSSSYVVREGVKKTFCLGDRSQICLPNHRPQGFCEI